MKRAGWVLLVALSACPPPKVPPPEPLAGLAPEAALAAADAAFAQRPNDAQVREAFKLYRSAAVERVEGSIGVVRTAAWLVEHGAKDDRKTLVRAAVEAGAQCQQRAVAPGPCDYWQAVALGLEAREQPLTALGALPRIIELLKKADAATPDLDDAGPARVLALLLARAPGWPTGPGNPDDALASAQKALEHAPKHPLNELALGECLAATGDTAGAKAAYERAAALASARGDADGAEWAAQAQRAFERL
ncbi:MAG: hypothetical protein ACOZQL_16195 [Myxococcota bacterium]